MNADLDDVQSCEWLYLHEIGEPRDNELRLVLHEAKTGATEDRPVSLDGELPEIRKLLAETKPIVHGPGCRVFELRWSSYIAYSVLNESFASVEPAESVGVGRLVVEYSKSVFLAYLARSTFASSEYPGPFLHWDVRCLNHIIQVASTQRPSVKVLDGA
jgi:hypothetical protein